MIRIVMADERQLFRVSPAVANKPFWDISVAVPSTSLLRVIRGVVLIGSTMVTLWSSPAGAEQDQKAGTLERSGWNALDAGQPDVAAAAFRDALASDPNNATLHVGAAIAAYAQRRDADARTALDRALALNPRQPLARELHGRLLYRGGDISGAIAVFEALVAEGRSALSPTLDRWRREAELRSRMFVAVGPGVTVEFEGPDDEVLAQRVLASIERAASRISEALAHIPTTPISVVLYTNEQFRDITQSPSWAGGAFDGTVRIPMRGALANPAELDRVLAHEYTHALVRDIAPAGVPAWLNEGLAAALENDGTAPLQRPAVAVPLENLEKPFDRLTGVEARNAYAVGAFAVRRLLEENGASAMTSLLHDIADGVAFEAAFEHRMGRTLSEFEQALLAR